MKSERHIPWTVFYDSTKDKNFLNHDISMPSVKQCNKCTTLTASNFFPLLEAPGADDYGEEEDSD